MQTKGYSIINNELTDVEVLIKECDTFTQLIQVKVWFDICDLYVHL